MTLDCRIYFYVQLYRIYILRYDRRFAYQSRLFKLLNTETAFRIISTPKLTLDICEASQIPSVSLGVKIIQKKMFPNKRLNNKSRLAICCHSFVIVGHELIPLAYSAIIRSFNMLMYIHVFPLLKIYY